MSQLSREEKLASFQQLTKVDGIKTGREFAESFSNKARILIDHPSRAQTGSGNNASFHASATTFSYRVIAIGC
jgi:hypothetical protein